MEELEATSKISLLNLPILSRNDNPSDRISSSYRYINKNSKTLRNTEWFTNFVSQQRVQRKMQCKKNNFNSYKKYFI